MIALLLTHCPISSKPPVMNLGHRLSICKAGVSILTSTNHEAHLNEDFKELCYSGNRIPERQCNTSFLEFHVLSIHSSRIFTVKRKTPVGTAIRTGAEEKLSACSHCAVWLPKYQKNVRLFMAPFSAHLLETLLQKDHFIPNCDAQAGPLWEPLG